MLSDRMLLNTMILLGLACTSGSAAFADNANGSTAPYRQSTNQAANTNSIMITRPGLGPDSDPNLRHMNWSRLKIRIVPDAPLVSGPEAPQISRPYVVQIAPSIHEPSQPPVMIHPSASPANIVETGYQPQSGFQSNIPAGLSRPRGLPSGQLTNLLYGKAIPRKAAPVMTPGPASRPVLTAARPAPITTATYGHSQPAFGTSSNTVRTAVKAERAQRGTLIGH